MPLHVLCDFDGTIVPGDVEFEMFERFGGPGKAGGVVARWERLELTARERIEQGFANLHVPVADLSQFIDDFPIDPTFPPFARFCREQGIALTVVSDGLTWYIRRILELHGVAPVPILANEIEFGDPGDIATAKLRFPHFNGDCNPCRQCGCCKRYVVRDHKGRTRPVAFISDGWSDRHAARQADLVFARDQLWEYCQANELPAIPFSNFDDVRERLEKGNRRPRGPARAVRGAG